MKHFFQNTFFLRPNTDSSWPKWKHIIYYVYRLIMLVLAGFGLGLALLMLAPGPYVNAAFTRLALSDYYAQGRLLLLNSLPVILLVLLFYPFTRRTWSAFLLGSALPVALSLGNYYKLYFRDDPVYFEDILLIREAKNMVAGGQYSLFLDRWVLSAAVCLIFLTMLLFFLTPGKMTGRKIWLSVPLVAAAAFALSSVYTDAKIYRKTADFTHLNSASYTQRYIAHGFLYPFIHSITDFMDSPPDGYTPAAAQQLLSQYEDADIPADRQISIIAIMREAYMDFSRFGIDGLEEDYCDIYHQLEAESYTGNLLTNAAYGFTVYTERNFLTGLTRLKDFRGNVNAYPWYFHQQGYTVEGSHPYYQWFYNRRNVNGYMGFERYRFLENDFENLTTAVRPEDSVLFSEIYQDFTANKASGKPYFSFSVTIATHGPYDTETCNADATYLTGDYSDACKNAVNNYLYALKQSDEALIELIDQLRSDPEPVVVVTFGDHLPWMGNGGEFYTELGIPIDQGTDEGFRTYYSTRYLFWANNAARKLLDHPLIGEGSEVSPCFLMNLLFQQLGWHGPAFTQAMADIMEVFPVITANGRYVSDGVLMDAIPEGQQDLLQNFLYLQQYWKSKFLYSQ